MKWQPSLVGQTAFFSASVATFLLLATALPFLNFRGLTFFIVLGVFGLSPFLVIALVLWFVSILTMTRLVVRVFELRQHISRGMALPFVCSSAAFALNLWAIAWLTHAESKTPGLTWLRDAGIYGILAPGSAVALEILVAGILLTVPAYALVVAAMRLRRRWKSSLSMLSILAGGWFCFAAGGRANDLLTLWSSESGIQNALASARSGERLPALSQAYPYAVLDGGRVAINLVGGFLASSDYIVYDPVDRSETQILQRMGSNLNRGTCVDHSREIALDYYWVTEGCP